MLKKSLIIIIPLLVLIAVFYYFFFRSTSTGPVVENQPTQPITFNPFNRGGVAPRASASPSANTSEISTDTSTVKIPILRQISITPTGGFMASSTASSSVVRYIDRGVGHVYEALSTSSLVSKISNTTIPKIYESYWNKNLNVAILRYIKEGTDSVVSFYAEIRPIKVSSSTDMTDFIPNEIKGKFLSPNIAEIAVSPKKDRIFTFNIENGRGVGYISGFDESKKTKVIDIPLTQVSVDWPEENTITLTTKPSAVSLGYMYVFDIKKGALTKLLGGIVGLDAKMSADAKKVIFSVSRSNGVSTSVYTLKDNSTQGTVFKTLPDKCVWSKLHPLEVYCAVPTRFDAGSYPDDWYKGNISFIDQIWHLDTATGEVHLLGDLLALSNSLIDATDLTLDPKENFLYFTNKRDLSLWSLDLTQ